MLSAHVLSLTAMLARNGSGTPAPRPGGTSLPRQDQGDDRGAGALRSTANASKSEVNSKEGTQLPCAFDGLCAPAAFELLRLEQVTADHEAHVSHPAKREPTD